MDLDRHFVQKNDMFVPFWPIFARKLPLVTPIIISIGMKLMYGEAKILEIPS